MHVLAGILVTLSAFWLSKWAQGNLPYSGLFNPAALVLLGIGHIEKSLPTHDSFGRERASRRLRHGCQAK